MYQMEWTGWLAMIAVGFMPVSCLVYAWIPEDEHGMFLQNVK
jgi:hypothetical protein